MALLLPLRWLGRALLEALSAVGRVVAFGVSSAGGALALAGGARAAASQAVALTLRCALPALVVVGSVGGMLALQALTMMRAFGMERALAPLCMATVVRELAPGFAAVVVAMQGGAGIAAELGAMRGNRELDALAVMGIDPLRAVAGPRIWGAAVASTLVNAVAIFAGILGAFLMAVPVLGVPRALFLETALDGITVLDVWVSELKAVLFGLGLGTICAAAGFFAAPGPAGVGRAANRAVVASVILVLAANYVVNAALFGLRGGEVAL